MTNFPGMDDEHLPLTEKPSWVERNGFSHWGLAIIWAIVAFGLFQLFAGVVATLLIFMAEGRVDSGSDLMSLMSERMDLVFIGNSAGQILFLAIVTWFLTGLHTGSGSRRHWLRFRHDKSTGWYVGITALLFISVQPVVWYVGYLNQQLPLPDLFSDLQEAQYEMIEDFLSQDGAIWIALFHVALVPAICEEVMFRGYLQRAFEKSWGAWPAIVVSGLLFGLYHLQLGNLLPLALLGLLLALVTWLSGSLYPAIVAHFVNNGAAVLLASFYPELAFAEMTAETTPPLTVLFAGALISSWLIYLLVRRSEANQSVTET
ncbi:MAG: type II CAAX endopeptidase family protein [Balneolaceae bacterium]